MIMKAVVDCNSFYCSCERLFQPSLANWPVVVLSNNDGCIIALTDEAKKLGVGMAAPFYQNRDLIRENNIAVFSSNYNLYGDLSKRVMITLKDLVGEENVEVYSIDESFLDLETVPGERLHGWARELKDTVETWTGIKVSIGIGPTKVLAKMANRLAKKDKKGTEGVMVLDTEQKIINALERTPVEDIWGVGRQYAIKLKNLGIDSALRLSELPLEWARKNLGGVVGMRLLMELKGESCLSMKDPLEEKKMIATTRMFGRPVSELNELKEAVAAYTSRAAEKLRRQYSAASQVDVFVVTNGRVDEKYRYNPQARHNKATLPKATSVTSELIHYATPLVDSLFEPGLKYLKAGVILGGIVPDSSIQANLFGTESPNRNKELMDAMDNINFSMRGDVVKYLASGLKRNWKMRQELRSDRYTTRWEELFLVH